MYFNEENKNNCVAYLTKPELLLFGVITFTISRIVCAARDPGVHEP